jgi:hypothetical protein
VRRLVWVGVGAVAAVVVIHRGRAVLDRYVPAGAVQGAGLLVRVPQAVRGFVDEVRAGTAEREAQLRHDLVGDVDVDELRAARARHRSEREPSRGRRAGAATDDPDDGELGYSFF